MLVKLSSLIAGTLAVYPTGPTDYGWNGGCMTLPASRWQAGVVSQWRNADTARPNPKSWHAEQMKLYLDLHDEAFIIKAFVDILINRFFCRLMRERQSMMIMLMSMTPTLSLSSMSISSTQEPLSTPSIPFNLIKHLPRPMGQQLLRVCGIRLKAVAPYTLKWMTRNKVFKC